MHFIECSHYSIYLILYLAEDSRISLALFRYVHSP